MIAVHKSAKDFTPFRSFPEDVTYFGAARTVDEAPSNIPGLPSNCLQLESIDDASQPPVLQARVMRNVSGLNVETFWRAADAKRAFEQSFECT